MEEWASLQQVTSKSEEKEQTTPVTRQFVWATTIRCFQHKKKEESFHSKGWNQSKFLEKTISRVSLGYNSEIMSLH